MDEWESKALPQYPLPCEENMMIYFHFNAPFFQA